MPGTAIDNVTRSVCVMLWAAPLAAGPEGVVLMTTACAHTEATIAAAMRRAGARGKPAALCFNAGEQHEHMLL